MQKIKEEIAKSQNNPYIQVVGEFLLKYLEQNPGDAEKINNPEKTIEKSLSEMSKVAAKKKVGNCAVLTDQEGFDIVLKYFDIEILPTTRTSSKPASNVRQDTTFNVSLDDFI